MSCWRSTKGWAMSEGKALVPKLRFPEFREEGGWASEPMGEVYSFKGNNSLSRDKLNYVAGSVKNIHYGDIHTKFSTHFDITKELVPFVNESEKSVVRDVNLCAEGDMIFADASEDMADIGKSIELVNLNGERIASGLHTILARQTGDRIALGFGGHLFKSGWIRTQIQKEAQGAKVLGISASRMRNLRLPLPLTKPEQQKIADCLSSLDELIAAQARKVDALKTHKKGLMQKLFPREGETLPRLRFPEFQKGVGWKMKKINKMLVDTPRPVDMNDETQYSLVTVKRRYGGVVSREVLNGRNIKVKSQFLVEADDFLISKRQVVHNACGLVPVNLKGCIVSNEYSVLTAREGCDVRFFNYFAQQPSVSESFLQASVGIVIEKMLFKLDSWFKREFLFPIHEEQQRIADCLLNLDTLITVATQELEALRAHKKGLMQQLFPSAELSA
jgi:type I restriction enzyme S subunit